MDSSFVVKPRVGLQGSYGTRDPVPVRQTAGTDLDPSKTVNAATGDFGRKDGDKREEPDRQDDPRSDHAAYEVAVDPETRDKLYRERDVRAAEREHPDQALLRQRAYGRPAVSGESPQAPEPHADIEA